MENQVNIGDQNTQQIGKDLVNQPTQTQVISSLDTEEKKSHFPNILSKKMLVIIVLGLIVTVGSVYIFSNRLLLKQTNPSISSSASQPPTTILNSLPKLAYMYTTGIYADTENPKQGTIFSFDPNTNKTESFYAVGKKRLQHSGHFLEYSPITNEILTETDDGIMGIKLDDKKTRMIFSGQERWMDLLPDLKTLCLLDESKEKYMKIDLSSPNTTFVEDKTDGCLINLNNYDTRTGLLANIVGIQEEPGPTFSSPERNTLTVYDTKSSTKKNFPISLDDPLVPVLNSNGFLFFKVPSITDSCSLRTLKQVNLATGEVSDPSEIPELWGKIKTESADIRGMGTSPDRRHYIYSTNKDGILGTYSYDIVNKKESFLGKFSLYCAVPDNSNMPWSTDSKYFFSQAKFSDSDSAVEEYVLYNMETNQASRLKLPEGDSSFTYIILQ